jgi:Flp pilus assembly pilin Flp
MESTASKRIRALVRHFVRCARDDRGVAMTEYTVCLLVTIPLICYLFHPDNGFYEAARTEFDMSRMMLMFPGH